MPTVNKILTVKEVAEKLNFHPETIREWVRQGKLPMIKPGCGRNSKLIISERKLDKFLEDHHYEYAEII